MAGILSGKSKTSNTKLKCASGFSKTLLIIILSRIWLIVGAGAASMYYLWHRGNASAQAAAGEETQSHHGPSKEKVKSPGDSVQKKERA